jgi:hypothetical protein
MSDYGGTSEILCNARCQNSRHLVCRCACGGENHGIDAGFHDHSIEWKPPRQESRRPSLRQERKAGQIFIFDLPERKRGKETA